MDKKFAYILVTGAVTVFTLGYAVTAWAMGGGCCGFCGL